MFNGYGTGQPPDSTDLPQSTTDAEHKHLWEHLWEALNKPNKGEYFPSEQKSWGENGFIKTQQAYNSCICSLWYDKRNLNESQFKGSSLALN